MTRVNRLLLATALSLPLPLVGQSVCRPSATSNESKLMAHYAVPFVFSSLGTSAPLARGEVRIGGDLSWVPAAPAGINSPDECYRTDKSENSDLAPVLPRPRLSLGLGRGLVLDAMYLPPIKVMDATPDVLSLALTRRFALPSAASGLALAVRLHSTIGSVKGPITCKSVQSTNAAGNCYGRSPSEDTYEPNLAGIEASIVSASVRNGWQWYGGAGVTSLRPRFQVGFDGIFGRDETRIAVDLTRLALFGGATWRSTGRLALSAEVYGVPEDATTIRTGASFRLR